MRFTLGQKVSLRDDILDEAIEEDWGSDYKMVCSNPREYYTILSVDREDNDYMIDCGYPDLYWRSEELVPYEPKHFDEGLFTL